MKKGEYLGHDFTPDQLRARALWERAQEKENRICSALCILPKVISDRAKIHATLDCRLNAIEAGRAKAQELFDEVGDSFTIATDTIQF